MATSTAPHGDVGGLRSLAPTVGLEQELAVTAEPQCAATGDRASLAGALHFFRHFGEMFLAMMVGMTVLGGLDRGILSGFGTSVRDVRDSASEAFALVMALNMTIGMTLWMRYRRHSWAMCVEMAGAMFAPAVLAIVLFRTGVVDGPAAGGVVMGAMVPAMIAAMLFRRAEYSQPVRSHARRRSARAEVGIRSHGRSNSHLLRQRR